METRVMTVVGRNGYVLMTDSVTMKAGYKKYDATSMGELHAIKNALTTLFQQEYYKRADERCVIILPKKLRGLNSNDTVNYWLTTKKTKTKGTRLTSEFLGTVADIAGLMNQMHNVNFVDGSKVYRGFYAENVRKAWACLDKITPRLKFEVKESVTTEEVSSL
jgi:hypothetical protein